MIPERLVPGTVEWQVLEAEHRQRYEYFAASMTGLRVLDVACGVGYGSQLLAERGALVTGVDISTEAVKYARTHFSHRNVEFLVCDAKELSDLGKHFDAAVSFETIEHLSEPEVLIREVHRVLAPGAFFACSTPNRDCERNSGGKNPYHLCEWNYGEFRDAFSRYFDIEGQFHQSPSAAYLRHLGLLAELETIQKKFRFSVAFRVEEMLRRTLGKQQLNGHHLAEALWTITPGDYVIEAFSEPSVRHGTLILTGRRRRSEG